MEFKSVKSSNVDAIMHNPETNQLHVRFKSGGTYIYDGVDAEKHSALMSADSIGGYIHAHVKGKHAVNKADT